MKSAIEFLAHQQLKANHRLDDIEQGKPPTPMSLGTPAADKE